ncbi:PREDICTED: coiled-coil domain-containing protein AGAP005037-like isoform X5 [Priapulus caudatus]|uniref:Coiled-coil domain-containing protein AGAP005037-like isoform X5 n=1 Tax=Priapulus caudatus TaxID=37621 RepID=A0ABM1E9Y2_PRICU|nr:PREDICTED: coiled-coil domain-containing protein AGAP005037-like isoform X5 [Priapulus caudatus]
MDHNAGAKAAIDFPKAWPTNPVNSTHKPKNNPGSNSTEKPKDKAEEEREAFFENLQRKYNYASFMDSKSADSSPTSLGSKSKKQERPTTLPTKKSPLGDDDPGMMSEAETSATGFRRGAKARSSLPIVRSPSKTLERPLGVVFLQFKNETKRALLPNEITSVDTVRALFVRAWPKKLTMEYLEDPNRCIYIHDFNTKDVFYELDDISVDSGKLRDIKDRCLLRIHDRGSGDIEEPLQPPDDLNYFSEPEFDSNYQSQHVHKTSVARSQPYTVRAPVPQPPTSVSQSSGFYGQLQPRGAQAPAPPKPARAQQMPRTTPQGILPPPVTTQPQPVTQQYPTAASLPRGTAPSQTTAVWFESHGLQRPPAPQGYISPQRSGSRSGSVTPRIVDEEARFRVESMEKKLADLTGLVHTALTKGSLSPLEAPGSEVYSMEIVKEKSKSLPPGAKLDVNTAQQTTDAISKNEDQQSIAKDKKSEKQGATKDKPKPKLPEKPASLAKAVPAGQKDTKSSRDTQTTPTKEESSKRKAVSGSGYATPQGQHVQYPFSRESLRNLHLRTQELKLEVKTLRRMTQAQAMNMKESIREVSDKIKNMLTVLPLNPDIPLRGDRKKIQQDQESYRQDVDMLEKVLRDLEGAVEELRSDVINRRCRVNMQDVESMAVALSHSSRAIADLKVRFPNLQDQLKTIMDAEMEVVVREEKFLKEEPDRLDNALKRCKRLTGTLFTLKRLASVQEQRAATTSSSAEAAKPDYRASNAQGDKFERNLELAQKALRDTQYMADTEHRLDRAISSLYERTGSSPSDYSPSFDPTRSKTPPRAGTSSDKDDHYSTVKRNLMSPRKDADTIAKVLVSDGSQKFVAATTSQGKDAGAAAASQKPPSSLSSSPGSSFSDALVPNDKRKQPPPPPPRRSRSLTSPLLSPTGMLSPIKEMSPVSGPPGGFGALLDPSMSPTIDKSNISKHGRSQSEPEDFDYTPGRAAAAGGRAHEVIRINAITDDLYTRAPVSSNSSSSESINSQEGTPSKDAAHALSSSRTSRQEMLARKHEELIMKQQALQEQYSRLQKELQKGTALTPTHKVNGDARAQSPKPKTPSAGPADDAAAVATATTQKRTEMKIYETDIL